MFIWLIDNVKVDWGQRRNWGLADELARAAGWQTMAKAVEQISRIERVRAGGRGKHLTGEAKRGAVN